MRITAKLCRECHWRLTVY